MATIAENVGRDVSLGRIFELAIATIRHNPGVTIGLALLVGALPGLALTYASIRIPAEAISEFGAAFWGFIAFVLVAPMIVSALTQALLTRATVAESEGRRAGFVECVKAAMAVLAPLVGLSILYAVAMTLGFALLIVPGVIVMLAWSVAAPVLIEEQNGIIPAIRRSIELTRDARGKIFGLMVIIGVAALLANGAVELMAGGLDETNPAAVFGNPLYLFLSTLVGTVVSLFSGTTQASLYVELRDWKDGPADRQLAEIFG